MKKKKYESPDIEVYFAYDLDTELMYGNDLSGGGSAGGLITGSNQATLPDSTDPDYGWDDDNSDL